MRLIQRLFGVSDKRVFQLWKSITVGISTTADEYATAIRDKHCRITDAAVDRLKRETFLQTPTQIRLVVCSPASLGFRNRHWDQPYWYGDILKKATECGLAPCLPDIGPQLRIEYQDQPVGERLIVAAPFSSASGTLPTMFQVYVPLIYGAASAASEFRIDITGPDLRFVHSTPLVFMLA
jgi:hypothetical protein